MASIACIGIKGQQLTDLQEVSRKRGTLKHRGCTSQDAQDSLLTIPNSHNFFMTSESGINKNYTFSSLHITLCSKQVHHKCILMHFSEIWDLIQFLRKNVKGPSFHFNHKTLQWFQIGKTIYFRWYTLMNENKSSCQGNGIKVMALGVSSPPMGLQPYLAHFPLGKTML